MTAADTAYLPDEELSQLSRYWRAANYLTVGQIYLLARLRPGRPLSPDLVKRRLLGHWGTGPGLNLVYAHLNRAIRSRGLDMMHVTGPGHGGPAALACCWLDGSYSEIYPDVSRDAAGMDLLFRRFSFPGGVPSHLAPETPGSIHEGGELGYSLAHAYGAAFDNPGLTVACVVGDGEAETGPLAAGWHGNKFLDPVHDGAVLPILHLNGWKIANPTLFARMPEEELDAFLRGNGHEPFHVTSDDPVEVHHLMAAAVDTCLDRIAGIQRTAREGAAGSTDDTGAVRPRWPVLVLRTPKGWTGPRKVDGEQVEGTWRSHQVPLSSPRDNPVHLAQLEEWLESYRPDELFDEQGRPRPEVLALVPEGDRRLGSNPHANGGLLTRSLPVPDIRAHAVPVPVRGRGTHEPTRVLGGLLRDLMDETAARRDFRLFGPDETASNRLQDVYAATPKGWQEQLTGADRDLGRHGRVLEVLSEHNCQGWLEGYLLTGRHGLFSSYEAFVHIVTSMANQHAKWLKVSRELPWRAPVPSLNYLLTSHVWRQDHNGFSHQDPGFVDHMVNKDPHTIRVYLPPDANSLLAVAGRTLDSRDLINIVVAGKQPTFDWLGIEDAVHHLESGVGIWDWASSDTEREPDVVLAAAGDVPTTEVMAAAKLLQAELPRLAVRVVNVVDLMRLLPADRHPHGLPDAAFDAIFPPGCPVVFAYHGYPWLIHRLTYMRAGHDGFHVRGYKEEGTTTTPFDMVLRNDMDRFRLVMDVIDRVPGLAARAAGVRQRMEDRRTDHRSYVVREGVDLPEIQDWTWG